MYDPITLQPVMPGTKWKKYNSFQGMEFDPDDIEPFGYPGSDGPSNRAIDSIKHLVHVGSIIINKRKRK